MTPAHTARWPELKVGKWVRIEVDDMANAVHASEWPHEPGRLGPKRERDDEEISLAF